MAACLDKCVEKDSGLHPELLAQINLADLLVFQQTIRFTRRDDPAIIHDIGAFTDPKGLADIVVGN